MDQRDCICVLITKGETDRSLLTYRVQALPLSVGRALFQGGSYAATQPMFKSRGPSVRGLDPVRVVHTARGMHAVVDMLRGGSGSRIKVFSLNHAKMRFGEKPPQTEGRQQKAPPATKRPKGGDYRANPGRKRPPMQPTAN